MNKVARHLSFNWDTSNVENHFLNKTRTPTINELRVPSWSSSVTNAYYSPGYYRVCKYLHQ